MADGSHDALGLPPIAPRPLLLIHGTADHRIPFEHSQMLDDADRRDASELWLVEGAEHMEAFAVQPGLYTEKMLTFFDRTWR